jgi:hypothetical protein
MANAKIPHNAVATDKLSTFLRKKKLVPKLARVSIVKVLVDEYAGNRIRASAGRSRYTLEVTEVLAVEKISPPLRAVRRSQAPPKS